uniref:Collagen type XII alpha 1 chain n=1 Tax=Pseudonaja textilis TaxID=8673 RepID=A0A670YK30_PSETE
CFCHFYSFMCLFLLPYLCCASFCDLNVYIMLAVIGLECKTRTEADIVLLVDGSWSIGRTNFKTIRSFIGSIVQIFDIALAQYSGDPRTEWNLNAHPTKQRLLDAVTNLPYKGGNTLTGMALSFILRNNFKTEAGMRPGAKKIAVLITDGKSQDDINIPSDRLKEQGVEIFAIGIKNADVNELKQIASDPDDTHAFNVEDFNLLINIVDSVTNNLCNSVKGTAHKFWELKSTSDLSLPPTNLVTSEVTPLSFRVSWTAPTESVDRYRVEYYPARGGTPQEVFVSRSETTTVLTGLKPETEYVVNVFSIVEGTNSEPLKGTETTLPVPAVRNLNAYDVTSRTMRVRWEPVKGATGYVLLYEPVNATIPATEKEMRVGASVTDVQLVDLIPNTEYTLTVHSTFGDLTSDPLTTQEVTLPLSGAKRLRLSDITHSSMKVSWDHAPGKVRNYIVKYKAAEEDEIKEVNLCILLSNSFNNFIPVPTSPPRNLQVYNATSNSLTVKWDPAIGRVQRYRINYRPATGDGAELSSTVGGNKNSIVLQKLRPDTPYRITVSSIYAEGDGGQISGKGKTMPRSGPRNIRVFDPTTNSLSVQWDHADGPVQQYRIIYSPVSGDPIDEYVILSGFTQMINGFFPLFFSIVYLNVTDLTSYNVGWDTFCIKWSAHRSASSYRLKLNPADGQEITVRGSETSHCFTGLSPDTEYNATVFVQTPNLEGPPVSTKEHTLIKPTEPPTQPPTPPPPPTIPPARDVCKGAKADIVFLTDASWSIGDENFNKVVKFVFNTIGAFDLINPFGIQVSFVQYSDDPKSEFNLNTYDEKAQALGALQYIQYRGGNTKTGKALAFIKEKVLTWERGMRKGVPKVLVVVTDGRSQDEVMKAAAVIQQSGFSVFVIGVADVDYHELAKIASQPSERHVFIVDDFDAFEKIEDNLITFVCETATSTCPLMYLDGYTSPGFRMLEAYNLTEKYFASVPGVSLQSGSFPSYVSYRLHKNAFVSQPTVDIHPDGLSKAYTIIFLFRLLSETPNEPFAIWQITDRDYKPQVGVVLDPSSKVLSFFNKDTRGEIQTVAFEGDEIKKLFYGSFHKVHLVITSTSAKIYVDCVEIMEKPIKEAGNITTDGYEILGKLQKGDKKTAPFDIQSFDIVCNAVWTSRDRCCDIPSKGSPPTPGQSPNSWTVCGAMWHWWMERDMMSQMCSIGFRSGERAGHSIASMPSSCRTHSSHMRSSIVLH